MFAPRDKLRHVAPVGGLEGPGWAHELDLLRHGAPVPPSVVAEPYFRPPIRAPAAAASRSRGWALIDSPTAAFIHDSG